MNSELSNDNQTFVHEFFFCAWMLDQQGAYYYFIFNSCFYRWTGAAKLSNLGFCERGLPKSWRVKMAIGKSMKILVKS